MKTLHEARFCAVETSCFPELNGLVGFGLQIPDPSLPGLDEVDAGDQPPAVCVPASPAKVRALPL